MVQVTGFDHIVLNVADVEVSAAWYRDKLGLELVRMEEWRRGEVLFPSLRIDATTLIDLLPRRGRGRTSTTSPSSSTPTTCRRSSTAASSSWPARPTPATCSAPGARASAST